MKTRKGHNVYPITVAQKFHLYYAKYCPNMAVLNIGTSLTIGTELDWNVLRDSINYAYARNEAMRIRFTRDNMRSKFIDPEVGNMGTFQPYRVYNIGVSLTF